MVLDTYVYTEPEQRGDDLLRVASHELRALLTFLKLQTQHLHRLLNRQGLSEYAAILEQMETQIHKLERQTADLLGASNAHRGRLGYIQESVDLNQVLCEITEMMQQMHPTHRIVVRGVATTSLIGDKDRLGQVFINLLGNAIKYSPHARTVEVDICSSAEIISVSVRDHGIGIPQEQQAHIFERFYRCVDVSTKAIPGQGIGLYVAAQIIKHHGGTITVESAPGKGSTFHVTLPLIGQREAGEHE